MKIRKATEKDKQFVKELDKENMQEIIEKHGSRYQGYMFESFNPNKCLIVEEKEPIGFAYLDFPGNKISIWSIQIKKQFQRKSAGQALMKEIFRIAKEKKLKKIISDAHKDNKQSINFHKKMGFKAIESKKKNKITFEYPLK